MMDVIHMNDYTKVFGFTKAFSLADENGNPWIEYVKVAPGKFIELFYGNDQENAGSFNHICFTCDDIQEMTKSMMSYLSLCHFSSSPCPSG